MVRDHGCAAAAGTDDIVVGGVGREERFRQRAGVFPAAGIGHRLPAAGLRIGVLDGGSRTFEQLHRRHSDVRVELVNVAGDEQADLHGRRILAARGVSAKRDPFFPRWQYVFWIPSDLSPSHVSWQARRQTNELTYRFSGISLGHHVARQCLRMMIQFYEVREHPLGHLVAQADEVRRVA